MAARAETKEKEKEKTAVAAKEEIGETKELKAKNEEDPQLKGMVPRRRARKRRQRDRRQLPPALASVLIGIRMYARTARTACSTIRQHARIGRKATVRKEKHAHTGT